MVGVIAEVAGWRREPEPDGVVLVAPADAVRLRIRPRLRWRRLCTLLDEAIATASEELGDDVEIVRGPIARWITADHEPAGVASARVVGRVRTAHVAVAIAGDDPLACVDAVGADARTLVTRVIEQLALGLGACRQRPFGYACPSGWIGVRRGGATVWLHPEFPRVAARITMFDARPLVARATQRLDRLLFMQMPGWLDDARVQPPTDLPLACGLPARCWLVEGEHGTLARCAATAIDHRFLYAGHFEGPAAHLAAFRDVFASLEPIPRGGAIDPRDD